MPFEGFILLCRRVPLSYHSGLLFKGVSGCRSLALTIGWGTGPPHNQHESPSEALQEYCPSKKALVTCMGAHDGFGEGSGGKEFWAHRVLREGLGFKEQCVSSGDGGVEGPAASGSGSSEFRFNVLR